MGTGPGNSFMRVITPKIFLVSACALLTLVGCNYSIDKTGGVGGGFNKPEGPGSNSEIFFEEVKTRVLAENCLSCHGTGSASGDLSSYTAILDFVVPGNADSSELVSSLKNFGGRMPRGGTISSSEAELIRRWINEGAKERANEKPEAPTPSPTPTPVPLPDEVVKATYQEIQTKILNKKCVMCHSDKRRASDLSLESYTETMSLFGNVVPGKPDESGLYVSVTIYQGETRPYMPPPTEVDRGVVDALTQSEQEAVRQWIAAGAQNN